MKYPRVLASIGAAGLATLCQCSLLFDAGNLGNGGPATIGPDATSDTGGFDAPGDDGDAFAAPDVTGDDGEVLDAAGGNEGLDAQAVGTDDTGTFDATGDAGGLDATADAITLDAPANDGDTGGNDALVDSAVDRGAPDAPVDSASDTGPDAPPDSGDSTLIAYYPFDESTGTTSADASGNNRTAMMQGATFSAGIQGNAATMNGTTQYVILPPGIVNGLTSFSISAWFYLNDGTLNSRVFDFGSGTTDYMFLTPEQMRFAISTSGFGGEQQIVGPTIPTSVWRHVAVTLSGATGTLYVNGVAQTPNTNMTLKPTSLGSTTQNWIGRSQYANDAYLNGKVDNFRIYNRALSAAEVQALFMTKM
ncbi:MAG TPA: LamG domain-containing protein [Polyangiaceae bacterium]|nr:LamG domain-containing protein [Polyangiaceae bacterium]